MWDWPVCRLCEVTINRGLGRDAGPEVEVEEEVVVLVSILIAGVGGSGF